MSLPEFVSKQEWSVYKDLGFEKQYLSLPSFYKEI